MIGTVSGGTPGANDWYLAGPITLACGSSDTLSGPAGISFGAHSASGDGYHTLSCTASDVAGNQSTFSKAVKIDGTPPVITATVGGGTLHDDGWYTGAVALDCQAADATSGVAGVTYGAQSADKDGETTLTCEAMDNAGNKADYSTTVRIDNTAPAASFQYAGSYCPSGWYNSPVEVSMSSSDAGSGVASGSFSQDGGSSWQTYARLAGGVYHLLGQAADRAGNTGTIAGTVMVDVTPPQTTWTIAQGSWVAGKVTLQGKSTDDLAGISGVEVSVDGGRTWVPAGAKGDWSFAWDTTAVPDGAYELLARATDNACNAEHTGRVTVNVDNTPPEIALEDPFVPVGRQTNVESHDAGSGLGRGEATFSGNGIEPRVMAFGSLKGLDSLAWDGTDASGRLAPYGIYTVQVDIWDRVGNHTSTRGQWVRVRPGAAVEAGLALPMIAIAAWLLAMCAALLRDGRWKELRGLHAALAGYRKQTTWHHRGGDDD